MLKITLAIILQANLVLNYLSVLLLFFIKSQTGWLIWIGFIDSFVEKYVNRSLLSYAFVWVLIEGYSDLGIINS